MGTVFAVGVPLSFHYLVQRYKEHGQSGDKVVQSALSWLYSPYRRGYEWWLTAEYARILLLTSCIGFLSRSCYVKMLLAQIFGLVFLALFLYARPYRRNFHTCLQALTMALPIFGLAYGLAGGWEAAASQLDAGSAESHASFDSVSIVFVHAFIAVPPILMGIFTVGATLHMWKRAGAHGSQTKQAPASEIGANRNKLEPQPSKSAAARRLQRDLSVAEDNVSWSTWSSMSNENAGGDDHELVDQLRQEVRELQDKIGAAAAAEKGNQREEMHHKKDKVGAGGGAAAEKGNRRVRASFKSTAKMAVSTRHVSKAEKKKRKDERKAQLRSSFSLLDTDGSGALDLEEFARACGASADDARVIELFSLLDEDDGGTVDCSELAHALRKNEAALALAQNFDGLREVVRLASKKKKKKKTKKKRRTSRLQLAASASSLGGGAEGASTTTRSRRKRRGTVQSLSGKGGGGGMKRKSRKTMARISDETAERHAARRGSLAGRLAAFQKRMSTSNEKGGGAPEGVTNVEVDGDGVRRLVRMRPSTALRTAIKMQRWAKRAKRNAGSKGGEGLEVQEIS